MESLEASVLKSRRLPSLCGAGVQNERATGKTWHEESWKNSRPSESGVRGQTDAWSDSGESSRVVKKNLEEHERQDLVVDSWEMLAEDSAHSDLEVQTLCHVAT